MTEKNIYKLVAVSFGLLCITPAALNIFLRLRLYKNILNLEGQYKNVTKERDELQKNLNDIRKVISNYSQNDWQYFNGSMYYISSTQKAWNESRADCLQRGADLIIINSREEQDFIRRLKKQMWIGLTDAENEGTWKWVDGTPLTTSYWGKKEPNGIESREEDCGQVKYYQRINNWNDEQCHWKKVWICEKDFSLLNQ